MPAPAITPLPLVVAELELQIGGRALALRLPMPNGTARLRDLIPALRVLMAGLTGVAVERAADEGRQVACRAGCGACCRQLVPLAGAEAQHLAALIEAMPPARRAAIEARFAAARTQLEAAGLWPALADLAVITDAREAAALGQAYFAAAVACPFLEDESCSIHPERPLSCREYLVSSAPERCADPAGQGVVPVKLDRRLAAAVAGVGVGGRPRYVAMTALFEWVARNPESPELQDPAALLGEVLTYLTGTETRAEGTAS